VTWAPATSEIWARWESPARLLVRLRHPLLLAFVFYQTVAQRSDADWEMLSSGGRALFGAAPLSAYADHGGLLAGPPSLLVVRGLNLLPGRGGEVSEHLIVALIGWLLLFLAERWTVPGAGFGSAPVRPGLATLVMGLFVLQNWGDLSGGTTHLDDGLALLTFAFAFRAISQRREVAGALLVGLAAAWKPWAVVALPMVWGLPRRMRALLIAAAVPAVFWLPFVIGDHATLSSLGHGLQLQAAAPARVLGLGGSVGIPDWWRTLELGAAVAAALLTAVRRDWRMAFAAGCAVRMLLDPADYDYYYAGLIMATAVTERIAGLRPWRTIALLAGLVWLTPIVPADSVIGLRFCLLGLVIVSWLHPWRLPDRVRALASYVPSGIHQEIHQR
jgi:hypothetical protein